MLTVGDLNLDFLRWDDPDQGQRSMIEETRDVIETKGFCQLVKGPTHSWRNTRPLLIDHAWTNNPNMIIQCKNVDRPVANHSLIETKIRLKGNPKLSQEHLCRKFRNADMKTFVNKIEANNWDEIYELNEVNLAYNYLEEHIREALDSVAPVKKVQLGGRRKGWISEETKSQITIRDNLKLIANRTNTQEDWTCFRKARNKVSKNVQSDKKKEMENLFMKANQERNYKTLFRITREKLGWNLGGPPSVLIDKGNLLTKPRYIAENLSEFFDTKIRKLKSGIPDRTKDPLEHPKRAMNDWEEAADRRVLEFRESHYLK